MTDKILITNVPALRAKYGVGFTKIQAAIKSLIAADKKRGIATVLFDVADAAAMKAVKGKPVTQPANARQNKDAVDAIYRALAPDYLVLLGSIDIIPHQDLKNPVTDPDFGDVDKEAPGDIPYACEAPYSRNPAKFIGPTRVVGRLPDLTNVGDPAYLVGVLKAAANWKSRAQADYAAFFSLTAKVWHGSTVKSLKAIFGTAAGLNDAPPSGPKWTKPQLAPLAHFINCHGAMARPEFFGEGGGQQPVAMTTETIGGRIAAGTVAAAECCYGGELYDPAAYDDTPGICSTYLGDGAHGFFGSSTIAYGEADENSAADLICQYFLRLVRMGASLGRATLEARQKFARHVPKLDPVDLKTLAQFNLLGDPSIHPAQAVAAETAVGATPKAVSKSLAVARTDRRRTLFERGVEIEATQLVAQPSSKTKASGKISGALHQLAKNAGMKETSVLSFDVGSASGAKPRYAAKAMGAKFAQTAVFHVVSERQTHRGTKETQVRLLVAQEVDGQIISSRTLLSR